MPMMTTRLSTLRRLQSTAQRGGQAQTQARRWMGGGQPESQSQKAVLWQGHPTKPEGWETTIYVTYTVATALFVVIAFAPDTSIQTWARAEAQARLDLKESGKVTEFEFGKHYNTDEANGNQADWGAFMAKAIRPGEDDDDDDDDDDEDEDEEEEEGDEEEDEDE